MDEDRTEIVKFMTQSHGKQLYQDYWTSRQEWADFLGTSRSTLYRYEEHIIRLVLVVLREYRKENQLDPYHRFILGLIHALSMGKINGKKYRTAEIKTWLRSNQDFLTREVFDIAIKEIQDDQ
jgi:hypothetical protein